MNFKQLNVAMQKQFEKMQQHKLFRLDISGQEIWDHYLSGFKPEQNPIFRDPNSSESNCNDDKNFIRRYGNICATTPELNVLTIFDIDVIGTKYEDTIHNLQNKIGD